MNPCTCGHAPEDHEPHCTADDCDCVHYEADEGDDPI